MNLAEIMDAVAQETKLTGVVATAYGWPVESPGAFPCAIVDYPESITFDLTFGRGSDRVSLPIYVVVGKVYDKGARDKLSSLIDGVAGIKQNLDGDLSGAVQSCRVTDCTVVNYTVAGVEYLAAKLTLDLLTLGGS